MGSISALAGILLVILLGIYLILIQDSFLNHTNHKYNVAEDLSMSEEALEEAVDGIIGYVKGRKDSPQTIVVIAGEETEFLNKKEIGHLEDIRVLLQKGYVLLGVLLILCIAGVFFLLKKEDLTSLLKGVRNAWGILLGVAAFLGVVAVIDLDMVVIGFHELFLSDSSWVLNPALDRSVWMFKDQMYKDAIIAIGLIVGSVAVLTLGGTAWLLKQKQEKGTVKNVRYDHKNK